MRTELYYKVSTGGKYYKGNNEWTEDIRYFDDFLKAYECYLYHTGSSITKVCVTVLELEFVINDPKQELKRIQKIEKQKEDFKNSVLLGEGVKK